MSSRRRGATRLTPDYGWLAEAVRSYNLSAATPIDVVLFVSRLQIQLAP